MEADKLYIIGGSDVEFTNKIKEFSNVIFLDKDQDKFKNKLSLIKEFQEKQSDLRVKWLNFQEQVFKKVQTYLDKDEDFSYLLANIFFEASPNKTNLMYKFFKLNIIFDYIKKENIKNIYLYNVPRDIELFFNKNADKLNLSVITLKIYKKKQTVKKSFKNLAKKYFIGSLLYHLATEFKKKKQKILPQKSKSNKVVFSYFYPGGQSFEGSFSSKYFEGTSNLINAKYNWLFLYVGNFSKLGKQNELIRNNLTSFGFLDSYFKISDFQKIIINFFKIRKKLKSIKTNDLFIFEGTDYLSLTKSKWVTSMSVSLLDLLIFEKKTLNFFKENSQIDEALYLMEFQPWEQIFNKIAKKYNIKTKGVIHSVVRPNVMNYYHSKTIHKYLNMPSYVGVNSDFCKSLMIKNGFTSEQVLKIEAQRFNYLLKNQNKTNFTKSILRKTILIITSIIPSETKEMLEFFVSTNVKFEKVYIKEHHLFKVGPIIKSSIKNFPSFEIFNGTVSDAFELTDIVYTANGSSVLLESVVNKKETVSLISLSSLPIPAIDEASNLHFVHDVNSLSKILKRLTTKPIDLVATNESRDYLYLNNELPLWQDFLKK
jgi:surface carbohydrate biosynthesis protein (TIGR04326 family)